MFLNRVLAVVLTLLSASSLLAQEQVQVSVLMGDSRTRQTLQVVADLKTEFPQLRDVDIRVYPSTRLTQADLAAIAESDIVALQIVGRNLVELVRESLEQAVSDAARVVAYGGSYNEDDRALGIIRDAAFAQYFEAGGAENTRNGLLYLLAGAGIDVPYEAPVQIPDTGIYEAGESTWYRSFDEFLPHYSQHQPDRPWVGLIVYRSNVVDGTTAHLDAVIAALEFRNFNVLTVFGYPPEQAVERFFFDESGEPQVAAVVAAGMNIGIDPDVMVPLLTRLNVPVINAISLFSQSADQWTNSEIGMDIMERSWQLAMPEMAGLTQPTVFAAKELLRDARTGMQYVEEQAIPERVDMLVKRVSRWVALQEKSNAEKRVLLQYFNFPPGREGMGAAYLNVVPASLWQVMIRLEQEGYALADMPSDAAQLQADVTRFGPNLPPWEQKAIDDVARSGKVVLLPMETYESWFAELPAVVREQVNQTWGPPVENEVMAYVDENGARYFVLPVLQYGNVILAPQPSRGTSENPEVLHHDIHLPPPHQYIAFYLWLQKEFGADVMLQFGTHGTHEWLPGKEAGMGPNDAPEYLVQDMPNLYAFIMDNTGEASIAMRRGMATMVSHLTPPFDEVGLNPEMRALEARLNDYNLATQQSETLAQAHLEAIISMSEEMGLLTDLALHTQDDGHGHDISGVTRPEELVDALVHYLEELSDRVTPLGMHTLGVAPDPERIQATAEAIVAMETNLDEGEREHRIEVVKGHIEASPRAEMDSIIRGMSGGYIAAGIGGDPLRTPDALPTGRNFSSFDPRRIPAQPSYDLGARLAEDLVTTYREENGVYPDKLTFTLWGVETMRHQGVQEAQIMALMGVRPVYDSLGVLRDVEAIPRDELARPRVDVTIIPSGLYRDLFSNVVALLDRAVTVAQAQDEADNQVRINMLSTAQMLVGTGVESELADRMAAVRLFSIPPGAYGTTMELLVDRSDTWEDEQALADVYFSRMSHMYGQGFWGENGEESNVAGVGRTLLQTALSGTDMTIHARSSNVFQVLDGDDPYASFGGLSLAVRAVDGSTPPVMISNLANPADSRQETLERYMGRELRSRYLNPEWIEAMKDEGYAGAKFMNDVVQNLWGWQVTVPEAVDAAKWNEMYATYVADRHDLGMEEFFRDAGNLEALQALMTRMLESVRKGYWDADPGIVADLGERVSQLNAEMGVVCSDVDCADPMLQKLVQADLVPVAMPAVPASAVAPGTQASSAAAPAAPATAATPASAGLEQVQGYAMEEVSNVMPEVQTASVLMQLGTLILLVLMFIAGFMSAPWSRNTLRYREAGAGSR